MSKKREVKNIKHTNIIFTIFLVLLFFAIIQSLNSSATREIEITYNQFIKLLEKDSISGVKAPPIKSAKIVKKDINLFEFRGIFSDFVAPKTISKEEGFFAKSFKFNRFKVLLPYVNDELISKFQRKGFKYKFEEQEYDWFSIFISFLPWLFFIGLWILMLRNVGGGAGNKGVFNFGKSKAQLVDENVGVKFSDVAGCEEEKRELAEIVDFLKVPEKYMKIGAKIPKGVLLVGPPGTGKTLLAKAVAGEAGVPFFSISGSDFVEMFVGVGAARVRDMFEKARKLAPCIIFIDEIDAVARQRGAGLGGGHDEREQTLNQLLVEMDGITSKESIIVMAATNRPDILDPAILRPGRFDRQVIVQRPDYKGRIDILKVHINKQKIPLGDDVDLEVIAKTTPGLSGAELANIVNEAAIAAARENSDKVYQRHFEYAKDKVTLGLERKSRKISEKERQITAYHEAGHAIVAFYTPEADKVHKVTIIPRGMALGITHTLPDSDRYMYSKGYVLAEIAVLLGGRAAEMIKFKEPTTGAGNDIKRATELARKMVCEWGMSDNIGPIALEDRQETLFLGREIEKHKEYSEKVAQLIDDEVRTIIYERLDYVFNLLKEKKDELENLAQTLLKFETVEDDDFEKALKGELLNNENNGDN